MINAVIIEDEKAAQEKLLNILKEVSPDLHVKAVLSSVKESIEYFRENLTTDIIFCDVQLPDGLAFEIFNETNIKIPVIFITGYNKFILYAFENNGIDYLLKPANKEDLSRSILKYKMLEKHFILQNQALYTFIQPGGIKNKKRLLVKKGISNISIRLEDIVMFYTENNLVYVTHKDGQNFFLDKTLNEIKSELDESVFFRANRQYIINLSFVKSFKPYEKVKLQVDLHFPEKTDHFIILTPNTAAYFRELIS